MGVLLSLALLLQGTSVFATSGTGEWTGIEPTNKADVTNKASISQLVPEVPAEYSLGMDPQRTTFLVQKLDNNGNGYNVDNNKDYYLTYSVDKTAQDNTVYVSLVDKASSTVLETKQITPGQTIQFDQLIVGDYKYTIEYQVVEGQHQLQVINGLGGSDTDTVVYDFVTSNIGRGFNVLGITVPMELAKHITHYLTVDEPPVELAKYTQTGYIATNTVRAAGQAEFEGYEYVAEKGPVPEQTVGLIAASYPIGTAFIQYYNSYKEGTVRYVTQEDGTARELTFIINPDHPNFKDYYNKTTVTADDLHLNEIMAVVNNPNRTQEDIDKLNSNEYPFLLTFVSEELAPGEYNTKSDALGRPDIWEHKTSKKWRAPAVGNNPGFSTDSIKFTFGEYNGYSLGSWDPDAQRYLVNENDQYIDLDGNVVDKQTVIIGGLKQTLANRIRTASMETIYYYRALKGSVIVKYVDIQGNEIKSQVTDIADAVHNTPYDTEIDNKPLTIVTDKGDTYRFIKVESNSADTIGNVVGGKELVVTYVYDLVPLDRGSVVVNYVDTEGNVIKSPVFDEEDADAGSPYDTTDKQDKEITFNGKTYRYKEIQNDSDPEKGNIEGGKSKNVTYVYELVPDKGSVRVNYVDEQGVVIKDSIFDVENADSGSDYDTAIDNKPMTIVTKDGKIYDYVRVQADSANENGQVVGGETLEVTYVYKLRVTPTPTPDEPDDPNPWVPIYPNPWPPTPVNPTPIIPVIPTPNVPVTPTPNVPVTPTPNVPVTPVTDEVPNNDQPSDEPGHDVDPEILANTSMENNNDNSSNVPKTGDTNNIVIYVMLMSAALVSTIFFAIRKAKKNN